MRSFYLKFPIWNAVRSELTWSHYCELLSISDPDKRSFYEKECIQSGWSVRELRRQKESMLFERLLLSRSDSGKNEVLSLAQQGVEYAQPADVVRDPYVFEFLSLPESRPVIDDALIEGLSQNQDFFSMPLSTEGIKRQVPGIFTEGIYKGLRRVCATHRRDRTCLTNSV